MNPKESDVDIKNTSNEFIARNMVEHSFTKLKLFQAFILLLPAINLFSQEPQFTQFYATPTYINPAYTGLTNQHRFAAVYRNQWPGVKRTYTSYMASYDYNLNDYNVGVGGFILQDVAGTSNLVSTLGGINAAYKVKTGRNSEVRGGVMVGMCQKKIDQGKLIFNDQFITGSSVSLDAPNITNLNYLDIGLGALFNSKTFWLGFSAKHINKPNISMNGGSESLPVFMSAHAGYRFIISDTANGKAAQILSLAANYRHELINDQLDAGINYQYKIIYAGVWYRGLPLKHFSSGYSNNESVAIMAGIEIPGKNLRINYSYDLTVSTLGFQNTTGAHEVTIVFEPVSKKKQAKKVTKGKTIIKQKF